MCLLLPKCFSWVTNEFFSPTADSVSCIANISEPFDHFDGIRVFFLTEYLHAVFCLFSKLSCPVFMESDVPLTFWDKKNK